MRRARVWTMFVVCLLAGFLSGCGEEEQVGWQNPLDVMEQNIPQDPNDAGYVLGRMEFAQLAMQLGSFSRAETKLQEAFDQLEVDHANVAASLSSERYKYYKGETYERAAVCWYLGYLKYLQGDYNTARIFFSRSLLEDRKAVVHDDTPAVFGDDYRLGYYWLGKAYQKLGEEDNARIAFSKAGRPIAREADELRKEAEEDRKEASDSLENRRKGEIWAYERFNDPEEPERRIPDIVNLATVEECLPTVQATLADCAAERPVDKIVRSGEDFFTPANQQQANCVLTIPFGPPPSKSLTGIQDEITVINRSLIRPHSVKVYVDGYLAGDAVELLDTWNQATTQDRIGEKEASQVGKAIAKTALSFFVNTSNWDVSGDTRHWMSLPGRVFVYAGRLEPGVHSITFRMYDANGNLLPRWTNTFYGIAVPADCERCVLLPCRWDADNNLTPDEIQKALDNGAKPIEG